MPNDLVSREAVMAAVRECFTTWARMRTHPMEHDVLSAIAALPAAGDEPPQTAEELRLEQIESIICQNKRFTVEEQSREIAKLLPPPQEAGDEPGI